MIKKLNFTFFAVHSEKLFYKKTSFTFLPSSDAGQDTFSFDDF
jgi:hypothetical protein